MKKPAIVLGFFFLVAVVGGWITPYSPAQTFESAYKLPPLGFEGSDARFLLGTDDVGRDQLSRLIEGARLSLFSGLMVSTIAMVFGLLLGSLAG